MSGDNQLAVYPPFVLAALLVIAAIAGSRLTATTRAKLQRLVILPLIMLVLAGSVWLAAMRHDYVRAALLVFMVLLVLPRLRSPLEPRQG